MTAATDARRRPRLPRRRWSTAGPQARRPTLRTRTAVRLRRRRLTAELAGGRNPADDPRLALQAARLTSADRRGELAEALEHLVLSVERPASLALIKPSRHAIERNTGAIDDLIGRLRSPAPLYARGLAMLEQLLRDGAGPVYCDRDGGALAGATSAIRTALAGS